MMTLIINLLAVGLIGFVIWWFWLSKTQATVLQSDQAIDVLVDNGVYSPALIESKLGDDVVLRFTREDASPCAEQVQFPDLGINKELPLNATVELHLKPEHAGEYPFQCQMGMYRGLLRVK